MDHPKIVSRDEWLAARKRYLNKEKEFTRLRDRLSADRRELPCVTVDKNYVFDEPEGDRNARRSFRRPQPIDRLPLHVRSGLEGGMPKLFFSV
jgi:predicted dithiol-disulfide oxidoreductase (DUF899 family)